MGEGCGGLTHTAAGNWEGGWEEEEHCCDDHVRDTELYNDSAHVIRIAERNILIRKY